MKTSDQPRTVEIDLGVDLQLPDDDERVTQAFIRAVAGEIVESVADVPVTPRMTPVLQLPDVEAQGADPERAARIFSDAALSADQAARLEHRRRIVAPLLMILALGLLFAAGWTC